MTKSVKVKNITLGEGVPKICVPLTGPSDEDILRQAKAARDAGTDLIEWRVDLWDKSDKAEHIEDILENLSEIRQDIPLIFTIRTVLEGGKADICEEEYQALNMIAAASGGADLIDVEMLQNTEVRSRLASDIKKKGALVIASTHDFQKTDDREGLLHKFQVMDGTDADILKAAVMPQSFEDTARLMQTVFEVTQNLTEKPVIAMSMGETGSISRIAGESFGSCLTFGTVGEASAPGQFPIEALRSMMEALHSKNATNEIGYEPDRKR